MTHAHGLPRVLATPPPDAIDIGDGVEVRRYVRSDARALRDAVTQSLEHLRPWMPWISFEPQTVEQRERLIDEWNSEWDAGTNFALGIFEADCCIGSTGFHLRGGEGSLEIGYWVSASHEGLGIVSRTVLALTEVALALPGITTVEIVTDEANERSAAVAQRCGYELVERFAREREAPRDSGIGLRWRKTQTSMSQGR